MVTSIYLENYYDYLITKLNNSGIPVSNLVRLKNKTKQGQVLFNPGGTLEDMFTLLVRNEIINNSDSDRFLYIGYSRAQVNRDIDSRIFTRTRQNNIENASSRKFVNGEFIVTSYVLSNHADLIEDFEEVYQVNVRGTNAIDVEIPEVFELDHLKFRINAIQEEIEDFQYLIGNGNMFGVTFTTRIKGPLVELDSTELNRLRNINIDVYNRLVRPSELIKRISKDV